MKTNKMTKGIVALLVVLAIVPALFAQGTKEIASDAIVGKIVSLDQNNGTWVMMVRDQQGNDTIFRPAPDCELILPIESMRTGDYVAVTTNGIMALSMPPQATAIAIQWLNPLVAQGIVEIDVPRTMLETPTALEDQFSYSYGYYLMMTIRAQGIFPYAGYFAKGSYDATSGLEPMIPVEDMYAALDDYQYDILMTGDAVDEVGAWYDSVEAISDLPVPEDLVGKFSYSYGYLLAVTAMSQGFELTPIYFTSGVLDGAYQEGQLYTEDEMDAIFSAYAEKLQAQMMEMLAEMASQNLAQAEEFLAENKNAEGVQTTDSGLQYKIERIGNGVVPNKDSVVRVDYELSLLDGQVMDSSYARGVPAEFPVSGVIPGFAEAVTLMPIGTKMRVWVHPSLGYGEGGTQDIEPNSLLIFDIEILGIVE